MRNSGPPLMPKSGGRKKQRKATKRAAKLESVTPAATVEAATRKEQKGQPEAPAVQPQVEPSTPKPSLRHRLLNVAKNALLLYPSAIASILAGLLAFSPRVSISVLPPNDPKEILSAPFAVSYDGPFPISDVRVSCIAEDLEFGGWVFAGINFRNPNGDIPKMWPGDTETLACAVQPVLNHPPTSAARIFLTVEFNPAGIRLFRQFRVSKFETVRQSNGELRWTQRVPVWKPPAIPLRPDSSK